MIDQQTIYSFSDELVKISQANTSTTPDEEKIKKEVMKRFLINTALAAGGAGVGVGLGELARAGLERLPYPKAAKAIRGPLRAILPVTMGTAALGIHQALKEKKRDSLREYAGQ